MDAYALLRSALISMILTLWVVPTRVARSPSFGTPVWDAGMNTRTPFKLMMTPPLTASTILPSRISPVSYALTTATQLASASTRVLSSVAIPSMSLTFTTFARTTSPTLNRSSSLAEESFVALSWVITPVVFAPRSRWISFCEMDVITPSTMSPVFKVFIDASSISAKFSCSFMALYTSCITLSGVDAPAVIET